MKGPEKRERLVPFLFTVILVTLALWLSLTPYESNTRMATIQDIFSRLDYIRYDTKINRWNTRAPHPEEKPIFIVDVGGKSVLEKGPWPWRYKSIVELILELRQQGAKLILFDTVLNLKEANQISELQKLLSIEKDNPLGRKIERLASNFDENKRLLQVLQAKKDTILPFILNHSPYAQGILPKPFMTLTKEQTETTSILNMPGYITNFGAMQNAAASYGFLAGQKDDDGITRKQLLVARHNNQVYLSLAFAAAQFLYPQKTINLKTITFFDAHPIESIHFGNQIIHTNPEGHVFLPSYKKNKVVRYISAIDVLQHKLAPNSLNSAIVFVGATSQGLNWFDKVYEHDNPLSDIEIQASTLHAILNQDLLYTPYWNQALSVALIVIIGSLIGLFVPFLNVATAVLLGFLLQALLLLINFISFTQFGIVLSLAIPMFMGLMLLLSSTVFAFLFERRRKTHLKNAFAQYIPPDYLNILLENPDDYGFEGQSSELTVLFADIRNFTNISENLNASNVKKMLNQFFTPMTRVILNHGGTIDKYVGDMIMAFWGAPIENSAHAEAAIEASLDMLAKTKQLKKAFKTLGLPAIELGIGLNTGLMNVGDMGSKFRRAYTVIGDAVNLGSRIQSATAYYGIMLLIGSATKVNQTKFIFRFVDKVKFKGRHEAENIYEVICRKEECTSQIIQELTAHQEALSAYFDKDWKKAESLFQTLIQKYPNQKIYSLFLERVSHFKEYPPQPDWDGAYTLLEK